MHSKTQTILLLQNSFLEVVNQPDRPMDRIPLIPLPLEHIAENEFFKNTNVIMSGEEEKKPDLTIRTMEDFRLRVKQLEDAIRSRSSSEPSVTQIITDASKVSKATK
jgi:hypothetical protein